MPEPEPQSRPPIATAPLSILLMGDGESSSSRSVAAWEACLSKLNREFEILVVNDGTVNLAETSRLRILQPAPTPGLGAVLRAGLAAARNPLLVCASGDPRYRPEDLSRLLERIEAVDLVLGYRVRPIPTGLRGAGTLFRVIVRILTGIPLEPLPTWLGWKSWLFHLLLRIAAGIRLHDVNCGLRLFRRAVVASIPVQADGPFALAEMIAKANFLGCLMDEAPVEGPCEEGRLYPLLAEGYRVLNHADFGPGRIGE